MSDVLERQAAENPRLGGRAEVTEDFLAGVIDSVADPIFVKDSQFRWVLLNDAFCTLLGKRREELLGKTDLDVFPAYQAEVFRQRDEEVFSTGREKVDEDEFTDIEGNLHTVVTRKTLRVGACGEPFIVGVIRDITERKRADDERERHSIELASERARLSDVFELAPAFIATVQGPEHVFKLA